MKKIYLFILFVLLMSFLPFQKAFALNCVQPPPREVAIHEYDVVVIATVTDNTKSTFGLNRTKSIKADVSLSFKGYNDNTITFSEDFTWGESKVGSEYLLFLNKKGNALTSPLCSPSSETAGLNIDKLIETLSAESTNVIEFDKTDESTNSSFSWGIVLLICTFIILVMIIAFIFYQRGKGKRNGKK